MASGVAEDDYDFGGDDAFDELPADTLHQLEEHALLSTQAPRLDRTGGHRPGDQPFEGQPSDYDTAIDDEEDVIDLNAEPISLPAARQIPTRPTYPNKSFRPPSRVHSGPQGASRLASYSNGDSSKKHLKTQTIDSVSSEDVDIQALLAQVEELRQQNEALQQVSRESQAIAQTRAGEAALLRRKIESTSSEYEKRLEREREAHNQAFTKQKADLEAAVRDRKKVEDSNRFLEHEARQAHAVTVPKRPVFGPQEAKGRSPSLKQVSTPKKSDRILPFRDGFDDDDVMVISPSKSRQRQVTPRKGAKRKRPDEPSPAKAGALEFSEPVGSPAVSFSREDSARTIATGDIDAQEPVPNEQYELLQQLLNYQPAPYSEDRFIEAMALFALPSRPDYKLSSFVMDLLQQLPTSTSMVSHVFSVLARTWKQCLDEAYYLPINILMATIQYVMSLRFLSTAAKARHELVPLITQTVDLVAIPVGLAGKNATELSPDGARIERQVNTQQSLELLRHICMACARTRSDQPASWDAERSDLARPNQDQLPAPVPPIEDFWRMVQFDFILVLLMRAQPKQAMRTVLSLLPTSCLAESFGTIIVGHDNNVNQEKQSKCEDNTLHRLLDLLFEVPKPLKGREDQAWDDEDLAHLRLDILDILRSMCLTQPSSSSSSSKRSHGSKLLAHHPRAIGKLFRFLSDCTSLLYTYPPPPLQHFTNPAHAGGATPHALTAQAINTTMRILHHLVTAPGRDGVAAAAAVVDVRQKLAAVPGGHHAHLVALSRLAFSDQILLDAGVDDGAVDAAHEMLDNYLTYEEGESLVMLFSTPTSRAATAAGTAGAGGGAGESVEREASARGAGLAGGEDVVMEAADTDDDGAEEL